MIIRHGTRPIELDRRDFSYHRTFGSVGAHVFLDNFCVDLGLQMPDQNAEGLPMGCTGETQTDNLVDDLAVPLNAKYTFDKTCGMEGHGEEQGCQIRASLKSTQIYGVQKKTETTDQEAQQHLGGQFYNVYDDNGMTWFDRIRLAVEQEQRGASCGSPWFSSWETTTGSDGIMHMPTALELDQAKKYPFSLLWHNYSCKGWRTINGVTYLMIKSWQGKGFGDNGWCYMSREIANTVFEIRGSGIFMQTHSRPEDVRAIKLGLIEQALLIISRILGLIRLN